jgi:hypothetical protein
MSERTLTQSLADDTRNQLKSRLEAVEILARPLCSEHDFTGALMLVAPDRVWLWVEGVLKKYDFL